jgi:hypothetical protein
MNTGAASAAPAPITSACVVKSGKLAGELFVRGHCRKGERRVQLGASSPGSSGAGGSAGAPGPKGDAGSPGAPGAACSPLDVLCVGPAGAVGATGPSGPQGATGQSGSNGADAVAPVFSITNTQTLAPGSNATSSIVPLGSGSWRLAFGLPAGQPNVLSIGTVSKGDTAAATITGTSPAQSLSLTLPRGDPGPVGPLRSLKIGNVEPAANSTSAAADIRNDPNGSLLDLLVPLGPQGIQGERGDVGPQGPPGGVLSFTRVVASDVSQGGTSLHHTVAHCAAGSLPASGGFSIDSGNPTVRSLDVDSTGTGEEVTWAGDGRRRPCRRSRNARRRHDRVRVLTPAHAFGAPRR